VRVFISWSGGKETALALYKVMKNPDIEAAYLLNMITEDGKHSRTHGIESGLLRLQAEATGIPIIQRRASWKNYEREFKKAISDLKKEGVVAGVFGDIDLEEHRNWVERVCEESQIRAILPLWKTKREELLMDFIDSGFKAIVVAARSDCLGLEWLGRKLDEAFIRDIKNVDGIDICGEAGEYHTFVFFGPVFKNSVRFLHGKKIFKGDHCFLELAPEF